MASAYKQTPTVGSKIAPHLELRAVLGEGGSATVFEAYHERLCAPVAVKVAMLHGEHAEAVARRLVREARLCARLDDPHFPRIYDISNLDDGRPYCVMEKVSGPTLDQRLEYGALDVKTALRITNELLLALRVAHAEGIIHRDVKPANVILQEKGDAIVGIRLMDFGIAHLLGSAQQEESHVGPLLETLHGEVLGTPGYMPPEQARGDSVDERSDVYAVGMVLYEMLLGRCPLEGDDPMAMLHATLADEVPDPRKLLPWAPEPLTAWITKAICHAPEGRFASASEALDALPPQSARADVAPAVVDGARTPSESGPLQSSPSPQARTEPTSPPPRTSRLRDGLWLVALVSTLTSVGVQLALHESDAEEPEAAAPADTLDADERALLNAAERANAESEEAPAAAAAYDVPRAPQSAAPSVRNVTASELSAEPPQTDVQPGDAGQVAREEEDGRAPRADVDPSSAAEDIPTPEPRARARQTAPPEPAAVDPGRLVSDYVQQLQSLVDGNTSLQVPPAAPPSAPSSPAPKPKPRAPGTIPDNPYAE